MGDLQFLSGGDRKAGPSNPMTPGFIQAFLASTPNQGSHFLEDFQMASRSASRRGSFSKSRPESPRISSVLSKLSDSGLKPPPPPDFEPPPGSSLFASEMMGLSDESAGDKPIASAGGPLFDSKEKSMLSNFLEGLEWNFDPVLPEGMPSFAAANEMANLSRNMENEGPMLGAVPASAKRNSGQPTSSGSGSGSATTSSQSPHDTSSSATSPAGSGRGHKRNKHSGTQQPFASHAHDSHSTASAAFGNIPSWMDEHGNREDFAMPGGKRTSGHLPGQDKGQGGEGLIDLRHLSGLHADMFRIGAGLETVTAMAQEGQLKSESGSGKKVKTEHDDDAPNRVRQDSTGADSGAGGNKRELLTESEKRQNHILSEQRRRNYIREGFKELVVLLDDGRSLGARALGLSSGFGSGVEDEGLDDRTDVEEDDDILAVGRKKPPKKAKKVGPNGTRARGKGRGRGGSAGGGAGSKSAVLFQAVDLIRWLNGKNEALTRQCEELEKLAGIPDPESLAVSAGVRS